MLTPELKTLCAKWLQEKPYRHNTSGGDTYDPLTCTKCHKDGRGHTRREFNATPCPVPDPLDMSEYEIAFRLRDLCRNKSCEYQYALADVCTEAASPTFATPEQMIKASLRVLGEDV